MIEFRTLGTTSLNNATGAEIASVLAQPKRIALLAYLAIARPRGFHRRSTLHTLFGPERDERHARWALNQALRYLRGALGGSAIRSRGAGEVQLDPGAVWCDAVAFEAACGEQRWDAALELYRGDLLQGFHVSGCAEFEQWLEGERTQLRRLASRAAWAAADHKEANGEVEPAVESARLAVELAPHDEAGVRRIIDLLDRAGDRAGALQTFEDYVRRLREEIEVDPAPETRALIARVRSRADSASASTDTADRTAPGWEPTEPAVAPRSGDARGGPRLPAERHFAALLGVGMLTVGAAISWASHEASSHSFPPRSIAVVPCTSIVQDARQRYVGEVVTEDLIVQMAKSRLFEKVIAYPSVARYRGSALSPRQIGSELGVDALLYCEYRQFDSHELVRVQLVAPRSATLLWTDDFERDLAGTVGATLPMLVVDALSRAAGLSKSERPLDLGPPPTRDPGALSLYKEGQYLLNQFTEEAVHQSIALFNESLSRDSGFALPYVGLARAYYLLGIAFGKLEPREAFPLMKQAAERGLALDDGLAEAHALLGDYEMAFGRDWTAAERHLREAIRLDPYSADALQSLAYYLTLVGRYDEVPALSARAIDMSPVDPIIWNNAGRNYFLAGRFEDALAFLQKGLRLAPDLPPLLLETGHLYTEMGDTRRGVAYLRRADSLSGHQVIIRGRLGWALALSGDSVAARAILRELKRGAAGSHPSAKAATAIAVVHLGLGERDSAFAWLDVAYEQRSGNLVHVLRSPAGWRLASDPRYHALLDSLRLAPTVLKPVILTSRQAH